MGKGKGKFDYWTVRLPVSRIVFELKGDVHEKVARPTTGGSFLLTNSQRPNG
jgi:ribosomal protein L16/L10AE